MKFLCVFIIALGVSAEICRTVALEGGGSHGAYEAGALWTLVNMLDPAEVAYDMISGISTGALNTGAMVQFPQGQEKPMADFLVNTWLTIGGRENVFKDWPGGITQGLLFMRGIYDTSPLVNMMKEKLTNGIQRKFSIGTTNFDTGLFETFDESVGNDGLIEAIMCSASPPFVFPYRVVNGVTYADGGCLINLDVFSAVNRCYEMTKDYSEIVVDLLFDYNITNVPKETSFKTLDVISRVSEIKGYNSGIWYYNEAARAYPDVKFRYVVIPSSKLPGGIIPLNFNQTVIEESVQMGKVDAARVIMEGQNGRDTIKKAYEEMRSKVIIPN